ncbi:MAG: hypothetical protein QXM89_05355 [Candidatus Bathyarchaeia archaeon]
MLSLKASDFQAFSLNSSAAYRNEYFRFYPEESGWKVLEKVLKKVREKDNGIKVVYGVGTVTVGRCRYYLSFSWKSSNIIG